jgi:Tol biopolymer transport system component
MLVQVATGGNAGRQPSPYFFALEDRAIVYRDKANPETGDDLVMWSLEGDSVTWRLDGPFVERNAALSPDGRWMAYQSTESGRTEVYVRPFPNVHDDQVRISNAGGYDPVWSRDGRELFYLGEIDLVAVSVEPDASMGSFAFGDRRVLMSWPYFANSEGRNFDVAPNGALLAVDARDEREQAVYIVTNWFEELRERVGN